MNLTQSYAKASSLLIMVVLILGTSLAVQAQNELSYHDQKVKYRVLAVQQANPEVISISNTVELAKQSRVYFPNAFSPDGDGVNDSFGAVGMNAEKYELKVFNKWGELLFESNRLEDKWDGTFRGQLVSEGAYVYLLSAREIATKKQISRTGTVTVVL